MPEIPEGRYHDDPRIQAELNMREARSHQSSPSSMKSPKQEESSRFLSMGSSRSMAGYGGAPGMGSESMGAYGGMLGDGPMGGYRGSPLSGGAGLGGMGGYGGSASGPYGNMGSPMQSQMLSPQSGGSLGMGMDRKPSPFSAMSDDDLEAEIAKLKGGGGGGGEESEEAEEGGGGEREGSSPSRDPHSYGYGDSPLSGGAKLGAMGGYGNMGSPISMQPRMLAPQAGGSRGIDRKPSPFSVMSDDDLEAEIAKLKGGGGGGGGEKSEEAEEGGESEREESGPSKDPYAYAGYDGGSSGRLPGGFSGSVFGSKLGRDQEANPVFSGSHPGLYPVEEMKPDSSHRLPFEGGGIGLENSLAGGGSLPGSGLPSQSSLASGDIDDLEAQEHALEDLKRRREALEKYLE